MSEHSADTATDVSAADAPARAGLVLGCLVLVAAVANLNLAVANVALPDIGRHFDASQTSLNLVAVGFSLGLAASVLWLGALGDRYGRKQMVVLGMILSVPAGLLAAWAPSVEFLAVARLIGGVAAGMAYPTTLALITALWRGHGRTRAIALWSALGGGFSALGPLAAGLVLENAWWGSVFLLTVPLAVIALLLALRILPAHVNESTDPVDNVGGLLSALFVAALVLGINLLPVPGGKEVPGVLLAGALVFGAGFIWRQKRVRFPLYDLSVAGRRLFWVAAVAGVIVFGSLMGAMFIGQQFLQDVLGYDTLEAGAAILPAVVAMVLVAPRSAKLVAAIGSRSTLLIGYAFVAAGFAVMLIGWHDGTSYLIVASAYLLVGAGVGFAGTPASNALTGSVPVRRAGMASATADLQRDLGGAIMQSLLGALLTAGYAHAFAQQIAGAPASDQQLITDQVQQELQKSFSSAANTAAQYPTYAKQITAAARESFVDGQRWAYVAGMLAVGLGALLVATRFPGRSGELELLAQYHDADGRVEEGSSEAH